MIAVFCVGLTKRLGFKLKLRLIAKARITNIAERLVFSTSLSTLGSKSGGCTRGSGEFLVLGLLVTGWVQSFVVVDALATVGGDGFGYTWLRVWVKGKRVSRSCG